MSDDPILRLAQQRMVAASADIEAQLSIQSGTRPVLMVLLRARNEAAAALARLACGQNLEMEKLREIQNEVWRYDSLVEWFRKIVSDGYEYDQQITAEDQEEMVDLLTRTPEGEQEAIEMGLIERNTNADS